MPLTRPRLTQFDTAISSISDPVTVLNKSSTLANIDVGFIINRNGGALANTAIFWNEGANTFTLAFTTNSGEVPNANIAISTYANLQVNTLNTTFVNATGNIIAGGNVTAGYFTGSGQFLTGLPTAYSNVNVKAYTESMGFQNYGNVNVAAYVTTNGLTNYSNVNVIAYTQTQSYTNYSNVNLAAYLGGAVSVGGNLTVAGNLIVQGTTTTLNSTTLDVTDLNITVAKGAATAAAANGAGLTVDGAGATLLYTSSTDSWNINKTFISNSFVNTSGNISTAQLNAGQINTSGNVLAVNFVGSGALLTALPGYAYSNVNVKAYTESMGFQNYGNVNVIAYLAGGVTSTGFINTSGNVSGAVVNAGALNVTGTTTLAAVNSTGFINTSGNVSAAVGLFGSVNSTGLINTSGNVSAAQINSATAVVTGSTYVGELFATGRSGDEGGQLNLAPAVTNSSLSGNITIDVFQNRLRIFESAGTNRGGYFDISGLTASAGTNLAAGGGGGTPGGTQGQIQFNSSSTFQGAVSLYYFAANGAIVANAGIASTSTSTGTMQIIGGVGVSGNLWIGSNIRIQRRLLMGDSITNANIANVWVESVASGGTANRVFSLIDTNAVVKVVRVGGDAAVEIQSWDATISTQAGFWDIASSGANLLIRDRAVGGLTAITVAKSTGNVTIGATTTSTSTTTGALQVVGGTGIVGNLNVGSLAIPGALHTIIGNVDVSGAGTEYFNIGGNIMAIQGSFGSINSTGFINTSGNVSAAIGLFGSLTSTGFINTSGNVSASTVRSAQINTTGNVLATTGIFNALTVNGAGSINSGNTVATGLDIYTVSSATLGQLTLHATTGQNQRQSKIRFYGTFQNNADAGERYVASLRSGFDPTQTAWGSEFLSIHVNNTTNDAGSDANQLEIARFTNYNGVVMQGNILPTVSNVYTLGNTTARWSKVWGVSVNAQYADLAEVYSSDQQYSAGTVVVFGGEAEVMQSNSSHDTRIAGVVSTEPAYLMNGSATGIPVALQGRVPCRVLGPVSKGDRVVSSHIAGVAQRLDPLQYQPGCIIGKTLENHPENTIKTIEVVVGRV